MSEEIKIYVADLAAYNNGTLHGVWIDATQELDNIWDQVNAMIKASPIGKEAEEYAIHDYEGFNGYSLSEYEGLENAHRIACFIEESPEIGGQLLNHVCGNLDEAIKTMEEHYSGCYKSLAMYAQELTEETSEIPKHLEYYIDYEKMGNDMEISGDIYTIETGYEEVHIFWNH